MDLDLNVRLEEEEEEDVNVILVEELRRMDLDLNVRLEEEEEEDVNVILEEETVAQPEQIPEEETVARRQHIDMPEKDKFAAYIALKALSKHRPVEKADKELVAQLLKVCLRTIEKIWKQALDMEKHEQEVDFSNKRKGNCGRMRKDLQLSERVPQIELNKRGTLRALARSLDVPYSTLQRRLTWGDLRRHTSSLKPFQSAENKIKRLKFCISMIDETTIAKAMPSFKSMENIIHINEKWFDMTKRNRTYYLLPEEEDPLRTVQNKNSIGKVMFLTAVAKPRYDEHKNVTFDGKVGIWAFVIESPAKYNSKYRDKGTMELNTINVTKDVMREYLCEKVVPAIAELWPDDGPEGPIFIQQDNCRTHVLPDDPTFIAAVNATGMDIQLTYQPPNSADMNVLDLCFFSSIQSLAFESAPNTLKELTESVEKAYDAYEVDTLAKVYITLQSVLVEVMKDGGGNINKTPHMGKDKLQREGMLPNTLNVDGELYRKTVELIADYEQKVIAPTQTTARKARRTGPQVILDDQIMIPGNIYLTWLNDSSSLVRKRRRVNDVCQDRRINLKLDTKEEAQQVTDGEAQLVTKGEAQLVTDGEAQLVTKEKAQASQKEKLGWSLKKKLKLVKRRSSTSH